MLPPDIYSIPDFVLSDYIRIQNGILAPNRADFEINLPGNGM